MRGPIPYTILRATQFFEFIAAIADFGTQGKTVLLPPVLFQPESAGDVAEALADIAEKPPANGTVELGGPERFRLDDLVRSFLSAMDDPGTSWPLEEASDDVPTAAWQLDPDGERYEVSLRTLLGAVEAVEEEIP